MLVAWNDIKIRGVYGAGWCHQTTGRLLARTNSHGVAAHLLGTARCKVDAHSPETRCAFSFYTRGVMFPLGVTDTPATMHVFPPSYFTKYARGRMYCQIACSKIETSLRCVQRENEPNPTESRSIFCGALGTGTSSRTG